MSPSRAYHPALSNSLPTFVCSPYLCPDLFLFCVLPTFGPGRVGAQSGLGPGPGWGPYGPTKIPKDTMLLKKH